MLRWPFRRKDREALEAETARELRAARARLRDVDRRLEAVHGRTSEISENSRTLRRISGDNHFAPLVRDAFGGRFG